MSDLTYAPPPFVNADGHKVIFVDFTRARYELHFDVTAKHARAVSEITFNADAEGYPVISMNQPVISACLDGCAVELHDQYAPAGVASFQILSKPVSPGIHVLAMTSELDDPGPYGNPITWSSDPARVDCGFNMSDLRWSQGGFLEAFLPSNLNFDHFRMSFTVTVENTGELHSIFTNGARHSLPGTRWKVEFPSYFTSCCPWFHLVPATDYQSREDKFRSSDGRNIPISIYTPSDDQAASLLRDFVNETKETLADLEESFGPFPHSAVVVLATGRGIGGMEYAGATTTELGSLRHELDHSYFARSVIPANGDAGWIDEAIAKWGDYGYPRSENRPSKSVNMGGRSPYFRTTHDDAYTVGREFVAHLDYVLAKRGGLKAFLKNYAKLKRQQSVTAVEFQELVEDFHGASLQDLFETYVYSQ